MHTTLRIAARGADIEVEADAAERGDPVVLIMGIGAQMVLWPDGFCERLRQRGFRVIRIDNRDVGRSTHLSHLPVPDPRRTLLRSALGLRVDAPYDLEDMADDVHAVLDALALPRAHIVGASMGGMIAQSFALRHPARATSLTSIMSTTGDRRYAFRARPAAMRALLGPPPKTREESVARSLATFRAIGSRTHAPDEAVLRLAAERSYDRGINPAGFARQLAAIAASGSRRKALATLRVPTLVIHGSQDPLIPAAAGRATARLIPGARLLELGDMGHDLPAPLWDTITDAIRSLARDATEREGAASGARLAGTSAPGPDRSDVAAEAPEPGH